MKNGIIIYIVGILLMTSFTNTFLTITSSAESTNQPPVFGSPSPVNGSTGNWYDPEPYGPWIPWNIPINDPDGDRFSWTIQCSNGQKTSGTNLFNGSIYLAITVSYSTTYKVWVNVTDSTGSGLYNRSWYTFTTQASDNNPPVFLRAPSPVNSSTGNLLSLSCSIRINDLENNSFNWSIECSNGQFNNSTATIPKSMLNGTKTLKLSGLEYSTTYKVWVNATDPTGSGLYSRKWFTFTTKPSNSPPVLGTPSPVDGSKGNLLSLSWSIPINDPQGNTFTWSIQCSNGQANSGTGASNGTKSLVLSGLMYSTTYTVWVNATDPTGSGLYTRRWFTFKTQGNGINPPVFGTPSPANGSNGTSLSFSWSIPISDSEENSFSWTIQCNGQTKSGTQTNVTKTLALSGLTYSTTYTVWVNATDLTDTTTKWYTFTTEPSSSLSIPTAKWNILSNVGEARTGPSIADINNDGQMEIIRAGLNGVTAYRATGTALWSNLATMWDSHIPLEIIDLNKDGYLDIICSYLNGTRALSGEDGDELWYNANAPLQNKHPVTGDINGDGYPEVFVCSAGAQDGSSMGKITYLDHNGNTVKQINTYFPCYGGVSLADANHDGNYELYIGERNIGYHGNVVSHGVRALWALNLTEIWCHPEILSSSLPPALADTNKDGTLEVVCLDQSGHAIYVFNSTTGKIIHNSRGLSSLYGVKCHTEPTIYDIDGDENLEMIVGGGSDSWSKALVWDLYTWSLDALLPFDSLSCWEPPAIADINGDGHVEIFECTIKNISIFDNNYVFRGSIPLDNNNSNITTKAGYYGMSIIIAQDIDNDGLLELVLNRYDRLYTYDTNGAAPTPRALTQFSYYSQHRLRSPYYTNFTTTTPPWSNRQPTFSNPSPANQSTAVNRYHATNVTVRDSDGNSTTVCFWYSLSNNPYSWTKTQQNNNVAANTTVRDTNSSYSSGWNTQYWWKVTAYDGHVNSSVMYTFTTKGNGNNPPVFGTPTPGNGSTGNLLSLSWSILINDLEANNFTWTIQCSNSQVNNATGATNGTKSLSLSGLAYSKSYTIWVNATDPLGSTTYTRKWYTFSTKSSGGGGGGGGNGGTQPSENQKPVADLSAGEPYQCFVNSEMTFDGSKSSDSDGNITNWAWFFGDTMTGNGKTVRHTYARAGTYTVTLTVTDEKGATNTDTTTCIVTQPNRPPATPTITGLTSGMKNTLYTYTTASTDADNDTIQYTFNWGDQVSQSSGFLPNGTSFSLNHSWAAPGRYDVTVTASDNKTTSSSKITVYIDAEQTGDIGYLLDNDGNGIYDAFYSEESKQITVVQNKNGNYTIDKDGDSKWDYTYNATRGLTTYQQPKTPGFELIFAFCAIAVAILLWNKKKII